MYYMSSEGILVTTSENLPGYKVKKVLGLVTGSIVMATHIGRDIVASLRNIVGGEVKEYTEMLAEARNRALERMIERAKSMGANAVIGVRFASSNVSQRMAEIVAYGTAVVVEKEF